MTINNFSRKGKVFHRFVNGKIVQLVSYYSFRIVVHHTATPPTSNLQIGGVWGGERTPAGRVRQIDDFHLNDRGWSGGVGYHFLIGQRLDISRKTPRLGRRACKSACTKP